MVWYTKKQNKYNAKKTEFEGITYDSKKEAGKAAELSLMVKSKAIKSWERQIRFQFWLVKKRKDWMLTDKSPVGKENISLGSYYLDYKIQHNDGRIELLEIKSFITKTAVWRLKWKLLRALYEGNENYVLTVEE